MTLRRTRQDTALPRDVEALRRLAPHASELQERALAPPSEQGLRELKEAAHTLVSDMRQPSLERVAHAPGDAVCRCIDEALQALVPDLPPATETDATAEALEPIHLSADFETY